MISFEKPISSQFIDQKITMSKNSITILLILFWIVSHASMAGEASVEDEKQSAPPRNYLVFRADDPIVMDGKANEDSWKAVSWSDDFIDIEGDKKPVPLYRTRFKMLWDADYIYIYAELEEPHIWAYYTTRDQIVYHENDFEIFIDPTESTNNYFEFELNAANTLFDLFLPKPYNKGGRPDISWNAKGFKSAVSVYGTLNDPTDIDEKWSVEVAIPFESLKQDEKDTTPRDGQTWRINFSRVEWKTNIIEGKYQKQKNENSGQFLNEDNWVWNPTGVINMHIPEKWGIIRFTKKGINKNNPKKKNRKSTGNEKT